MIAADGKKAEEKQDKEKLSTPRWIGILIWITIKLVLISAMIQNVAPDFIYEGF